MAQPQSPASGNTDPFDILSPPEVAAQEAQALRQAQTAQWMARAQMDPRAGINYNAISGVGSALGAIADKLAPQGDSPGVAKAKVLQQVLREAQSIPDPIAQREYMAKRMLELGQNQEAGKFQEQVLKMRKALSDNAKTDAEAGKVKAEMDNLATLPERDFQEQALKSGYKAPEITAALLLRKAGDPTWRSVLLSKHTDATYTTKSVAVPGGPGEAPRTILVNEQVTGPDVGSAKALGATTQVTNNNTAHGGAGGQGGQAAQSPEQGALFGQKQFTEATTQADADLKVYSKAFSDAATVRNSVEQIEKSGNPILSAAVTQNIGRVLTSGGERLRADGAVGEAGSIVQRARQMVLDAGGAGLSKQQIIFVKEALSIVEKTYKDKATKVINDHSSDSMDLGFSNQGTSMLARRYGVMPTVKGYAPDPNMPHMAHPRLLAEKKAKMAAEGPQPEPPIPVKSKDTDGTKRF